MPIGANILRQHLVEIISDPTIGGIYTDGVRDPTLTSGPWTWLVPKGVCLLKLDALGGGGGGGSGWNTGAALAGGGGGSSGIGVVGIDLTVIPGALLTISIGAGGSGGVSGGAGASAGGRTTISGLTRPYFWRRINSAGGANNTIEISGGSNGSAASATASGFGGGGNNSLINRTASVSNGTTGLSASFYNWNGASTDTTNSGDPNLYFGGRLWAHGAAAGGAAHTTPTIAGGSGGGFSVGGDLHNTLHAQLGVNQGESAGNTDGVSVSRGGGGTGAHSFIAFGGGGGAGAVNGFDGTLGSGGGGGGGGANGGKGGAGYVRFVYWSAD